MLISHVPLKTYGVGVTSGCAIISSIGTPEMLSHTVIARRQAAYGKHIKQRVLGKSLVWRRIVTRACGTRANTADKLVIFPSTRYICNGLCPTITVRANFKVAYSLKAPSSPIQTTCSIHTAKLLN